MYAPEKDWVKKRKTRSAIGRRTVLEVKKKTKIYKLGKVRSIHARVRRIGIGIHLSKILEIVKLIEGVSPLP